jgi:endonuclease YncB( thermonuclease family)
LSEPKSRANKSKPARLAADHTRHDSQAPYQSRKMAEVRMEGKKNEIIKECEESMMIRRTGIWQAKNFFRPDTMVKPNTSVTALN